METSKFCMLTDDELLDVEGGVDPVGLFGFTLALGYAIGKIIKYYTKKK